MGFFMGAGAVLLAPLFASASDKVDICHFTGSDTNPMVVVSVDAHSLPAHFAQGDLLYHAATATCGDAGGGGGGGQV